MGNQKRQERWKIFFVAGAAVLLIFALGIGLYRLYFQPKFFLEYMTAGAEDYAAGAYEDAAAWFEKAVRLEKTAAEPYLALACALREAGDAPGAANALLTAQDMHPADEALLLRSIDIISGTDGDTAYQLLQNFAANNQSVSDAVQAMLQSAEEIPEMPEITPAAGQYVSPVTLQFDFSETGIGHKYYYTTDGSQPDNWSDCYTGEPVVIDSTKVFKIVGYNVKGESSVTQEYHYTIKTEPKLKLERLIKNVTAAMEGVETGEEAGNVPEEAMTAVTQVLERCATLLSQEYLKVEDCEAAYQALSEGYVAFLDAIIPDTDKTTLEHTMQQAAALLDAAVEGSGLGEYKEGAKGALQAVLDAAQAVFDDLYAAQETIDAQAEALSAAVLAFQEKKNSEVDVALHNTDSSSGQVTVSLLWKSSDRLDLFVTSPGGDTVSYMSPSTASGGRMDVNKTRDSATGYVVENIYWNRAASGKYVVRVNVSEKNESGATEFRVRVVSGGTVKLYRGSIGSGTADVCTFSY